VEDFDNWKIIARVYPNKGDIVFAFQSKLETERLET
jgi:hypothetical protein